MFLFRQSKTLRPLGVSKQKSVGWPIAQLSTHRKPPIPPNPEEIKVIQATAPILRNHGLEITKAFYPILFYKHPELKNIFNMSHQRGNFAQPQALANAIYGYADNINSLENIQAVVTRIAHKHCSVKIKPEMYPWVGDALLLGMSQVLGEACTPAVLEAWSSAYGFLSQMFINIEEELYEKSVNSKGWREYKPFRVADRVRESGYMTSFYLQPQDGQLASFLPGQYITLQIHLPTPHPDHANTLMVRNYSISSSPSNKEYYRVSINRDGVQDTAHPGLISTYFHDYVNVGSTINVGAPFGDFYLPLEEKPELTKAPLVFLAGGSGITPILSMVKTCVDQNLTQPIYFFLYARNGSTRPFKKEIDSALVNHPNIKFHIIYSDPLPWDVLGVDYHSSGYFNLEMLRSQLSPQFKGSDHWFYFCGPHPFMFHVHRGLQKWGVPEERINFEYFGPETELHK